jgi:hypothetical protein
MISITSFLIGWLFSLIVTNLYLFFDPGAYYLMIICVINMAKCNRFEENYTIFYFL